MFMCVRNLKSPVKILDGADGLDRIAASSLWKSGNQRLDIVRNLFDMTYPSPVFGDFVLVAVGFDGDIPGPGFRSHS
jgi:hypothetical protein